MLCNWRHNKMDISDLKKYVPASLKISVREVLNYSSSVLQLKTCDWYEK